MAEKLTPQQHQAVHNRGGRLLVSAAAGSGKTKVLVDRLMTYLKDPVDPADLDDFLIITYTKAAATELRGKIAAKLTEAIASDPQNRHLHKQMPRLFLTKISTVHGFCSDLLREYAFALDLAADFRVADDNECREIREQVIQSLLDRVYTTADQDPDFRAFVDTQGLGRDDRLVPEIIEKVYDSARCHLDPEKWLEDCLVTSQVTDTEDAAQTVWGNYLMEDLHEYLDCQIRILEQCCAQTEPWPELDKVTLNLKSILFQMQILRKSDTWDRVVRNRNVEFGRLVFPRKNADPELAARIKAVRGACKKGLEKKLKNFSDSSEQVLLDLQQTAAGARGLVNLVRQFEKEYSAAKRSRRCLDFSDLEQKTLDLLLGKSRGGVTAVAREVAERFREILVDEYQDSNGVQDAIFTALTGKRQNCFLVGDVKQSIYQFRLADPGIFLEKYQDYVPAEEAEAGQGRKVLLSHNFRSGGEVIEAVNDIFYTCMRPKVGGLTYTEAEALREGIPHNDLPDPAVTLYAVEVQEETYPEEAAFVAEEIQKMLREGTPVRDGEGFRPVQPEDIVILLRSPGSTASYFQRALEARGIRCNTGSGTDLLQTGEVATVRSFLQTILNPRQDIPLIATLASPIFGFTSDDLAAIRSRQKKGAFYDALLLDEGEKTRAFLDTLDTLRREARMNTLTGLLEACLTLTRLDSVYAAMPGGAAKSANLQQFYQLASDFEKGSLRDIQQFLDHLDALEGRGLVNTGSTASGCVTIMSIHKSKGLEFPVVFLSGLSRRFNQESLRAQILCDKTLGLGMSAVDRENRIRFPSVSKRAIAVKMAAESISEEMRVLYVAVTRARDRLVMTYAARNLEGDIEDNALRQDFDGGEQLCRDATCLGDWVLMAALRRTEAGALHMLGGRPGETAIRHYPWKIRVVQAPETVSAFEAAEANPQPVRQVVLDRLKAGISFRYPHEAATHTPSKQTATGRKGRQKDEEAARDTREPKQILRSWRKPSFGKEPSYGKAYGNAIHAAMQYIRYENCQDTAAVREELSRLAVQGFLTEEQAAVINPEQIAGFFATDVGRRLCSGAACLREFKFSILDDADQYGPGLEGEQVLLQGVVDCALLEEDGITVVDFKSDYVTEESVSSVVSRYAPQIQTYADALRRIYERPVKKKYLYLFRLNALVEIP